MVTSNPIFEKKWKGPPQVRDLAFTAAPRRRRILASPPTVDRQRNTCRESRKGVGSRFRRKRVPYGWLLPENNSRPGVFNLARKTEASYPSSGEDRRVPSGLST